ncbi:putative membrane protein [Alteromonas macleodii]|nr:putative membrane protein [Alteromonas macleodii]
MFDLLLTLRRYQSFTFYLYFIAYAASFSALLWRQHVFYSTFTVDVLSVGLFAVAVLSLTSISTLADTISPLHNGAIAE